MNWSGPILAAILMIGIAGSQTLATDAITDDKVDAAEMAAKTPEDIRR